MAKMTKAQAKRSLKSIDSKSKKLWASADPFSTADMIAIEKIVRKNLKRLG